MQVRESINAPMQLYCVAFVQCGENKLVTFGKPRMHSSATSMGPSIFAGTNSNSENGKQKRSASQETNAFTIAGYVKTIQPRKCSCSSLMVLKDSKLNLTKSSKLFSKSSIKTHPQNFGLVKG